MEQSRTRHPPERAGNHLVLYDGVCGLCSRLVSFILAHDRRATFDFAALQGDIGRSIVERRGDPADLTTLYVVEHYRTPRARVLTMSHGVLFVATELGWPWKLALIARLLPARLLDAMYRVVARSRYRVFGRLERCPVPPARFRDRFVG